MKLNDFKSFIDAHKRTFKLKTTTDKPEEKITVERRLTEDGSDHPQLKHLPYHSVLRPRIVPRHHLHSAMPVQ